MRQSSRGNRVRKLASGVIAIARLRQHELRWQKIASLGSKTRRLLELHGREKAGNENAVVSAGKKVKFCAPFNTTQCLNFRFSTFEQKKAMVSFKIK